MNVKDLILELQQIPEDYTTTTNSGYLAAGPSLEEILDSFENDDNAKQAKEKNISKFMLA